MSELLQPSWETWRFLAESDGTYRMRIAAADEAISGTYAFEVYSRFFSYWNYGREGDEVYFEGVGDPDYDDEEVEDDIFVWHPGNEGLVTCLQVVPGTTVTVEASSEDAQIIIDVFDNRPVNGSYPDEITASSSRLSRIRADGVGQTATWTTEGDAERDLCLELWVAGGRTDYTYDTEISQSPAGS